MASFFGDTLGAYMLPRAVLELLQQPGGHNQAGVCPDSGFAWLLSGSQLYIWRYREGKEARLRVLTLPRPPATSQPPSVALIAHGSAASGGAAAAGATSGLGVAGPAPAAAPAAADGPLSVAVCDGDGHLTVWLDAHHLAAPAEQQLLAPPAGVAARQVGGWGGWAGCCLPCLRHREVRGDSAGAGSGGKGNGRLDSWM